MSKSPKHQLRVLVKSLPCCGLGAVSVQGTLTQMWTETPEKFVMKSTHHTMVSHHTTGFDEFHAKLKDYWDQARAAEIQDNYKK